MTGRVYKFVVLISFLILLLVQLNLIYNTYTLKDRDFNLTEKQLLNDAYGRSIPADKVFPGGGAIIDSILRNYMPMLEETYRKNFPSFERLSQEVSNSIFKTLRLRSNMDSVFQSIVYENKLDTSLRYLLTFQSIVINFDPKIGDISLFDSKRHYPLIEQSLQEPYGIIIAGHLPKPTLENRVTNLSVSGTLLYDYRVSFSLFVDRPNRMLAVFRQVLPTFSLVAICILIIVGINYYTYINWMKQKKDAEIKSDFLNGIKHEFNTPISTILVASKSLADDEVLENRDRIRSLVQIVERQARRLQAHINQILEISLIKKKVNLVESDLNYQLMVLVNDYRVKLQAAEHLSFDPHATEILLMIDTFAFTTMINNMLDNAFKHNQRISKYTQVFIDEQEAYFALHIKDNGMGIDESIKDKVFDKFFRSNADYQVPGLGLGLHYVKECIELHGWTIRVKTTQGVSTEFIVYIPKQLAVGGL